MPELPEVETSRRGIAPYLVGAQIVRSLIRFPKLRWPIPAEIIDLKNQPVLGLQRRAKYLILELPTGWIIIHLGMSGSLKILSEPQAANKHDHIDLELDNGKTLRYTDPRRFGAWLWTNDIQQHPLLRLLGPEPLSYDFDAEYLIEQSKGKRLAIKQWLMDNKLVVGVGNIYASESLFSANLLPMRPAGTINTEEATGLVAAIKQVLQRSIDQGGTTLRDFLQSDGKPGYFAQQLQVYGRAGAPCFHCQNLILSQRLGQRNTFWCPHCQH